MNNGEILLILNTNYHVETVLSLYESAKRLGYTPTILLDYEPQNVNPQILDYELKPFLSNYGLCYIESDEFIQSNKQYQKYVYISGDLFLYKLKEANFLEKKKLLINKTKDASVFISHVANYAPLYKLASNHFVRPEIVSVVPFSQKYGLNFIYQIENPILNQLHKVNHLPDVRKFLILGRFCWYTRNMDYIRQILQKDSEYPKFQLIIMGQHPTPISKFVDLENYQTTNIDISVRFDVSETEFYSTVNECDFLINLIDYHFDDYFKKRFSSNIHHTIAFNKPSICFLGLNLPYNIPCVEYDAHNFLDKFEECLAMSPNQYNKMSLDFDIPKENMRHHNSRILSSLFS